MVTKTRKNITSIPIQDNKTLEVTSSMIKIYKDKETTWAITIDSVRSIKPTDAGICIHYIDDDEPNPIKCERETFNLATKKITAEEICQKIFKELVSQKILPKNDKGLLYIRPDEHIISTYSNVSIDNEIGLLYITNKGIVHETDHEISIDLSFEHITFIKDNKKGITIGWDHALPYLNDPILYFEIILPKSIDRGKLFLLIREHFTNFESNGKYNFLKMDKYYSNLTQNELYKLIKSENKKFFRYIKMHTRFTFGDFSPYFSEMESKLIIACKLQKWNINLIADKTTAEERQRIFTQRHIRLSKFIKKGLGPYKKDMEQLAKDDSNSDKVRDRLKQDVDFLTLHEKLDDIRDNNQDLVLVGACINKGRAESMRYYDKRVEILYKKWCKKVPLQKFTNEYDDEWIYYLLDKLNTPLGHDPIDPNCIEYRRIIDLLENRDGTRALLEDFSPPPNTKKKNIYNNCWYDEKQKMWYLDDNVSETLQRVSDSDPDKSYRTIGRYVWGFKKSKVKLFCGFPSVICKTPGEDTNVTISISRNTGQLVRQRFQEYINYILPVVGDKDSNPEMEAKLGEMIYQSTDFQNTIHPTGTSMIHTPKLLKFACKRFGFADLPLNERVRRGVFSVQTGLFFNPEADTYLDTNEDPRSYPDTLNDERFD